MREKIWFIAGPCAGDHDLKGMGSARRGCSRDESIGLGPVRAWVLVSSLPQCEPVASAWAHFLFFERGMSLRGAKPKHCAWHTDGTYQGLDLVP